jgi:dihydrofolate synthase/folylpolyglutamate synthase
VSAYLGAAGKPARINAGLALACVRALGAYDDGTVAAAVRSTFPKVRLPARLEVLAGDPEVIVDAAHTIESARALARALEGLAPDGFDLLLSVSADKDVDALLDCLLDRAGRVWVTQAEPTRSLTSDALARRVEASARAGHHGVELRAIEDPEEAARLARASLPAGSRLCATGSVYLAGIARRVLGAGA